MYAIRSYYVESIVQLMKKKSDAKLIFVTTTFVPENEAGRFQVDALRYNGRAKKIMQRNKILVNDIYDKSVPIHQQFGKGTDDVHYTA